MPEDLFDLFGFLAFVAIVGTALVIIGNKVFPDQIPSLKSLNLPWKSIAGATLALVALFAIAYGIAGSSGVSYVWSDISYVFDVGILLVGVVIGVCAFFWRLSMMRGP
jgi:hypothetical protein